MKKIKFSKEEQGMVQKSIANFQNETLRDLAHTVVGAEAAADFSRSSWDRIKLNVAG